MNIQIERRNSAGKFAQTYEGLKHREEDEYSADRSASVESFEQVARGDHKLTQKMKPFRSNITNNRESNAVYEYSTNEAKSFEKLQQHDDRLMDDKNCR